MADLTGSVTDTSHSRQVARGTLVLTAFQFASKPLFAVFFILLGNRAFFSSESYGRLETLLALVNTFLIFADCGLETFTTRGVSRDLTSTTAWLPGQVSLKAVLTLFSTAGLMIWLGVTDLTRGQGLSWGVWLAMGSYLIALSAQSYLRAVSRGHYRLDLEGKMAVLEKAVTLAAGGVVLFWIPTLAFVSAAFACGSLCAAVYALAGVRCFEPGLRVGLPVSWKSLRDSYPFALASLCIGLFFNMDRILLSFWSDDWVASYSRGLRLVLALLLFPQMLSIAVYPTLSRLRDHTHERLHVSRRALQGILLIALPCVAGGWVLAGPLMDLLYRTGEGTQVTGLIVWLGKDSLQGYQTEAACLRILLTGLPFMCGNYLFGPALNALDRETWNLRASATTTLFSLVLNLVLIPFLGPVGAALATTLTQAFYCTGLYLYVRREDASWIHGNRLWVILGLSLAMAAVLILCSGLPILVRVALGGLFYGAGAWLLGLWPGMSSFRRPQS